MEQHHIVKSFDDELGLLDSKIAEMGGLSESLVSDSIDSLARRDAQLASQVIERDKKLDFLENEVNDISLRVLALRQPMAEDLRAVVAALKISADIERIGDLATNVAKRAITISTSPPVASTVTIIRMGIIVQGMIKSALDSYIARDAHQAMDVWNRDEEVDQLHTSLFREMLTYMLENPPTITACTHLMFAAKNIERIGDHVTNIAERVYFLVTGDHPSSERPKEDTSSFTKVELKENKEQ